MSKKNDRNAAPAAARAPEVTPPLTALRLMRNKPREQIYKPRVQIYSDLVGVRIAHEPAKDTWLWFVVLDVGRIIDGSSYRRSGAENAVNAWLFHKGYVLPPEPPPSWGHSSHREEPFAGPFATRDEAIADGSKKHKGAAFVIAQIETKPDPCTFVPSDMAQSVIELMRDRAEDSDYLENGARWPVVAEGDLAKLQRLIEHWADEHVEVPFWRVEAGTHEDIPATRPAKKAEGT